jgi:hypothetical protein
MAVRLLLPSPAARRRVRPAMLPLFPTPAQPSWSGCTQLGQLIDDDTLLFLSLGLFLPCKLLYCCYERPTLIHKQSSQSRHMQS